MKIARKLSGMVLVLAANMIVLGQPGGTVVTDRSRNAVPLGSERGANNSERLREEQLAVIKAHVLTRVLANIKQMDEAGLRLSVRNQVLNYLAQTKFQPEANRFAAGTIAKDALADLEDHGKEIPAPMAALLMGDLSVWLERHEPALLERFLAIKTKLTPAQTDEVRSLLSLKDGGARAALRIDQELAAGHDLEALVFHLTELQRRNYPDLEQLLARILELAERGPVPSLQTINSIRDFYLQSGVSTGVKQRFLALVVSRTQPGDFENDNTTRQIAYDLLTASLPSIQRLLPNLYNKAATQAFVARVALTSAQSAVDARRERLSSSVDPVSDLLDEAELTKSASERNELIAEAAQLALQKKKLARALDIVGKLDVDGSMRDFWRGWADQFLNDVSRKALDLNQTQMAQKCVALISSPLSKVDALMLIFKYAQRTGDETTATTAFEEAIKTAGSDFDRWEKARAFFMLSVAANRTTASGTGDLLESGIKVLNSVDGPPLGSTDRERLERHIRNLGFASQPLSKAFRNLSKADENRALSLVEKLEKIDFRSFAMIGILLGLEEH